MQAHNNDNFKVELTGSAFDQIILIQKNDHTIHNQKFRLKIGGKGCDGFTYDMGFTDDQEGDLEIIFKKENESITLIMDKFTFYYCKEGTLDYVLDPLQNQDGFVFSNKNEAIYHGKFFKAEELVPTKDDL